MSNPQALIYIGIDVSKQKLDIFLRPSGEVFSIANEALAIQKWLKCLEGRLVERIVLEATGGLETLAVSLLAAQKLPVVVVNPRQVRGFARAFGKLAKTDALDAQWLAHFAEVVHPEVKPIADETAQHFSDLILRRQQLLRMRTAEQNRLPALMGRARESIEQTIAFLSQQLAQLDQHLDQLIQSSPIWNQKEDLLKGIPGIGQQVSRTLLACLPELGTLSAKEISALAGLAPYNHDSGQFKGRRRIYGGRSLVRQMLYMAAVAVTRTDTSFAEFYQRLRQKGKSAKVALIACAHKILVTANAILKNSKAWDENYFKIPKIT